MSWDRSIAARGSSGERKILKISVPPGARSVRESVKAWDVISSVQWPGATTHGKQELGVEVGVEIVYSSY